MPQNTTHAVMAQRSQTKVRPPHPLQDHFDRACLRRGELDDFPTPPWAGRAWCEYVLGLSAIGPRPTTIWEPAANRGFLVRGLSDYATVTGTDVFDYRTALGLREPFKLCDFLSDEVWKMPDYLHRVDWIVTNPPFASAQAFIETGMKIARRGVAVLVRSSFLETVGRYHAIFRPGLPHWAWSQFVERVPMVEGRADPAASTATAYGWLTIFKEAWGSAFIVDRRHIPPCRARLEREGDYQL